MAHLATGQVATVLGITEPRLNDLVRRRKIEPAPPVRSGRRLWDLDHILQVASLLGLDGNAIRQRLEDLNFGPGTEGRVA